MNRSCFSLFIVLAGLCIPILSMSQTLIATTNCSEATANHNQRKIAKNSAGDLFVVYTDSSASGYMIRGTWYDQSAGTWSSPADITPGNEPTLTVDVEDSLHLVFCSNDTIQRIKHIQSDNFINWTSPLLLSDSTKNAWMPVADADRNDNLNCFWIEHDGPGQQSLHYTAVHENIMENKKLVTTRNLISDLAIANNLMFLHDTLHFVISCDNDSIILYHSFDNMTTFDTSLCGLGSSACITENSYWGDFSPLYGCVRLLCLTDNFLSEIEWDLNDPYLRYQPLVYPVDFMAIDNVAPPVGYSFLFMQGGTLYHAFSYGSIWSSYYILDTISYQAIHPSIKYRYFDPLAVDIIWMEWNGSNYNILYERCMKHIWMSATDPDQTKGFSITGFPNPFQSFITIEAEVNKPTQIPEMKIMTAEGKVIEILKHQTLEGNRYSYQWQPDESISSGFYLVWCRVGEKTTVRKVEFIR